MSCLGSLTPRAKAQGTLFVLVPQTETRRPPLTRSVCLSNLFIALLQPSVLRSLRACSEWNKQTALSCGGRTAEVRPRVPTWVLFLLLPIAGH